jgi:hypothetical protein
MTPETRASAYNGDDDEILNRFDLKIYKGNHQECLMSMERRLPPTEKIINRKFKI